MTDPDLPLELREEHVPVGYSAVVSAEHRAARAAQPAPRAYQPDVTFIVFDERDRGGEVILGHKCQWDFKEHME